MIPVSSVVALMALGQLSTVTLRISDQTEVSISGSSCGSDLSGTFQTQISATSICSDLDIFVTDAKECPDTPGADDLSVGEVTQTALLAQRNQMGTVSIPVSELPFFEKNKADGGAQCGALGVDRTHTFCATVTIANELYPQQCASKSTVKGTGVTIHYDTQAPGVPTIDAVEPFDEAAAVSVSFDSDTATVQLETRAPDAGWIYGATLTSTERTKSIGGLTNGVTYEVRAKALDAVQPTPNESDWSEPATVTPRYSEGFWGACRQAGCPSHGCSTAAAAPLVLLALGSLTLRRRVRR